MTHLFTCRVYYEDTDAGGVVYYANYLKFAERARTELLREANLSQQELLSTHQLAFVVRSCQTEFLRPAKLDDLLTIETRPDDMCAASIVMEQTVRRGNDVLATLSLRIALVRREEDGSFRPARLPAFVREALARA